MGWSAPRLILALSVLCLSLVSGATASPQPRTFPSKGTLVFTCTECGNLGVTLMHPDGRVVHASGLGGGDARWNPQGNAIAYAAGGIWLWHQLARLDPRRRRCPACATGRRLTDPPGSHTVAGDSEPAWFPTGQRLVFVRAKQTQPSGVNITSLWTVSVTGGHAKLLFAPPQNSDLGSTNVVEPD